MKLILTLLTIATNGFSSWCMCILAIIIAFFAPIQMLIIAIVVATILDMITAIIRAIQKSKEKGIFKLKVIKSNKIRRTVLKLFAYISIIVIIFLAEVALFTISIYAANAAAALILLTELKSICENFDILLKKDIFTKIFKKINSIFTNKIEKQISLKEDDKN